MYGKTLDETPERFDEFLEEFRAVDPETLDEAFRIARGRFKEFPTPAEVRACLELAPRSNRILEAYERRKEAYLAAPPRPTLPSMLDSKQTPKKREIAQLSKQEVDERLTVLRRQLEQIRVKES